MAEHRGVTDDEILSGFASLHGAVSLGLQAVASRFDRMDERFGRLEQSMLRRFDAVDVRFDAVDRRIDALDARVARRKSPRHE